MRRQRRMQNTTENNFSSSITYAPLNDESNSNDLLLMERASDVSSKQPNRFENTIEAKVDEGDTLQALALRFHCTAADIKRLNKIDKDNEIHARKVVKIPVTVHSVLLGTLPTVHTSGNSSPKRLHDKELNIRNPLEEASALLDEKLLVASVSSTNVSQSQHINSIVMNSKLALGQSTYTDEENPQLSTSTAGDTNDPTLPLISDILDDRIPHMRQIPGPSMTALDWSGSDCDMSWICLFIGILALCFVIPLIYIIYLAEHPHHHNHHPNVSALIGLS